MPRLTFAAILVLVSQAVSGTPVFTSIDRSTAVVDGNGVVIPGTTPANSNTTGLYEDRAELNDVTANYPYPSALAFQSSTIGNSTISGSGNVNANGTGDNPVEAYTSISIAFTLDNLYAYEIYGFLDAGGDGGASSSMLQLFDVTNNTDLVDEIAFLDTAAPPGSIYSGPNMGAERGVLGPGDYSLLLLAMASNDGVNIIGPNSFFASSAEFDFSLRLIEQLTPVPLPASGFLFLTGLFTMGLGRRRKKSLFNSFFSSNKR